ncbi:sensor histidine kinase [Actinomadura flavalba]|uniref:sensor histidine kinase n=1 Tax=Actinomadura flavalba TaxID=1120938 RepID=UPI00037A4A5B|nr:sensor histidine kinase [Actinomadura flavalba]
MHLTTRRDALYAVAGFGGGLLVLLAQGYIRWDTGWDPALRWRLIPLGVLSAALLLRRTRPMLGLAVATAANAADLLLGPSFGSAVIYTDALYSATVYGPRRAHRWLLGAVVGASLACAVVLAVLSGQFAPAVFLGAVAGTTWVSPVLTGLIIVQHGDRAAAERQRAEQVARLAELDRRSAVTAERTRMARELHDVIANHLSAVALHSSAVLTVPDLDREGVRRSLEVIRENSVQGLTEMRRMIGLLRAAEDAADPPRAPRLSELDALVERCARPGLTARLEIAGEPPELPAAVELAAYRIVQESLTNALKHGGAGQVRVRVEYGPDQVGIDVISPLGDGTGLPGSGNGLVGMRERALLLDGVFEAGPADGRWRVRAELPVAAKEGGS